MMTAKSRTRIRDGLMCWHCSLSLAISSRSSGRKVRCSTETHINDGGLSSVYCASPVEVSASD